MILPDKKRSDTYIGVNGRLYWGNMSPPVRGVTRIMSFTHDIDHQDPVLLMWIYEQ